MRSMQLSSKVYCLVLLMAVSDVDAALCVIALHREWLLV